MKRSVPVVWSAAKQFRAENPDPEAARGRARELSMLAENPAWQMVVAEADARAERTMRLLVLGQPRRMALGNPPDERSDDFYRGVIHGLELLEAFPILLAQALTADLEADQAAADETPAEVAPTEDLAASWPVQPE